MTDPKKPSVAGYLSRAGVTYRRLDYWTSRGWIRTEGKPNPGSGDQRSWSESELDIASLMARLIDQAGLMVDVAARVAREVVDHDEVSVKVADGIYVEVTR